jgi:hypothetical protein
VPPGLDEREAGFRTSDADPVAGLKARHHAAVDHAGRTLVWLRHDDLVGASGGVDDGAVGERVWIEWREHERIEILADEWASGREVVGGGPYRRRDDQPVGAVRGGGLAVHDQADLNHRKRRARED